MECNCDTGAEPNLCSPPESRVWERSAVPGQGNPRPLVLALQTIKPRCRAPGWCKQHLPERGAEQGRMRAKRRGAEGEETSLLQRQICHRVSSCSPLQNGKVLFKGEETMAYLLLEQKPLINLAYVQKRAITCPPTLHSSSSAEQPPFHPVLPPRLRLQHTPAKAALLLRAGQGCGQQPPGPAPPKIWPADPVPFVPGRGRQPAPSPSSPPSSARVLRDLGGI